MREAYRLQRHEYSVENSKLAVYRSDKTISVDIIAHSRAFVPVHPLVLQLRLAGV